MFNRDWGELAVIAERRRQRATAPRTTGMTMVIDTGLSIRSTEDVLEVAGDYIDLWKLSFGSSVFVRPEILARKLAIINATRILTCPGGTLFEAAILQHHCRVYMARAVEAGFTAVEISDGTIELPAVRRQRVIDCARNAGLVPITEVGKKDPAAQPPIEDLARQALRDLDGGARWVVVEGRESGKCVGVYDAEGAIAPGALATFAHILGDRVDRLIWEAPLKNQQAALIQRFGLNVGLGNIAPHDVLALEALRAGLRFETLQPIAAALAASGQWIPGEIESNGNGAAAHVRPHVAR
jgi:phosphosulfolactate synthase